MLVVVFFIGIAIKLGQVYDGIKELKGRTEGLELVVYDLIERLGEVDARSEYANDCLDRIEGLLESPNTAP